MRPKHIGVTINGFFWKILIYFLIAKIIIDTQYKKFV